MQKLFLKITPATHLAVILPLIEQHVFLFKHGGIGKGLGFCFLVFWTGTTSWMALGFITSSRRGTCEHKSL